MGLEITELFPGDGTKRLVISYKEGSDFDLVLQKLQSDSKAGKSNKGISKLIRDLVVATHGCKVFQHHSEIDQKMFEQFCLEALGIISGYREIVRGYLTLQGAVTADESEFDLDQLDRSNSDDEDEAKDKAKHEIKNPFYRESKIAKMFKL
jgi:hypothetical protein